MIGKEGFPTERKFTNSYGERWVLQLDPETGNGQLFGDETGWDEAVKIQEDVVDPDFILSEDEAKWLATTWLEVTGRRVTLPPFNKIRNHA